MLALKPIIKNRGILIEFKFTDSYRLIDEGHCLIIVFQFEKGNVGDIQIRNIVHFIRRNNLQIVLYGQL